MSDGETVVGRITITRVINRDGVTIDHRDIDDGHDGELDQTTAIAMLAVAQHAVLCDDADTTEGGHP